MLAGESPVIYGDGRQSRDFTYVENVVAGNLLASSVAGIGGKLFNIASGTSYSLLDLVSALNRLIGTRFEPQFKSARVGDVRDSLADISAARSELGYEPHVSFPEGLRRTLEAMQDSSASS
jgi:UDP-glucose 4-epimerase